MSEADWSNYWKGSLSSRAFSSGGVDHPVVDQFWQEMADVLKARQPSSLLDVACGAGALTRTLKKSIPAFCEFVATDYSLEALLMLKQAMPESRVFVGDAGSLPLGTERFDAIVSQYGLEYAGVDAIKKITDYSNTDSILMLLMHAQGSQIWVDSERGLQCLQVLKSSELIESARDTFDAAFEAIKTGEFSFYQTCAQSLFGRISWLGTQLDNLPHCSAVEAVSKIKGDVIAIHDRIEHHDQKSVTQWLKTIQLEIEPYRNRLDSMMQAALSQTDFFDCRAHVEGAGFEIQKAEPLLLKNSGDYLGYKLVATR